MSARAERSWEDERPPIVSPLVAAALLTAALGVALFRSIDVTVAAHRPAPSLAWARTTAPPPAVPPAPPVPIPAFRPPPPPSVPPPPVRLAPSPIHLPPPSPPRTVSAFRPPVLRPRPVPRPAAPAPRTAAAPVQAPPGDPHARDTLEGRIRAAVQAALRYPASARDMGEEGRALVGFDYRDRTVSEVRLLAGSGNDRLDLAALRTVRDADYPSPGALAGRTLPLAVWVVFRIDGDDGGS